MLVCGRRAKEEQALLFAECARAEQTLQGQAAALSRQAAALNAKALQLRPQLFTEDAAGDIRLRSIAGLIYAECVDLVLLRKQFYEIRAEANLYAGRGAELDGICAGFAELLTFMSGAAMHIDGDAMLDAMAVDAEDPELEVDGEDIAFEDGEGAQEWSGDEDNAL